MLSMNTDPTISEFAARRPWPFQVGREDVLRVAALIGVQPVDGRVPQRYVHVLGAKVEEEARQRKLIASTGRSWIAQMDELFSPVESIPEQRA